MSATVSMISRAERRARFSESGQDRTFILRAEAVAKPSAEQLQDGVRPREG